LESQGSRECIEATTTSNNNNDKQMNWAQVCAEFRLVSFGGEETAKKLLKYKELSATTC
jgi:hypothetical protein